jgi:hypothetical protein
MRFHFFATSSGVRNACLISLTLMLVNAFSEHYLSIVCGRHRESPASMSIFLDLKVATVRVLPGLGLTREFVSEKSLCHFRERTADAHLMEYFSEHNILYETIVMNKKTISVMIVRVLRFENF